jgi:hypothetical protein
VLPSARTTSCQVVPSASRYWRVQLFGGIMPPFASSGESRYHHTPVRSTVTANGQVRVAVCRPTCGQVPHDVPYFVASFSNRPFVPSLRPPTFSQPDVKDAPAVA